MNYVPIKDILKEATPPYSNRIVNRVKKNKKQLCVEHFQIAYIMREIEKKSMRKTAACLNMTTGLVKKISESFVYKKLVEAKWLPLYLCADTVIQISNDISINDAVDCTKMTEAMDNYFHNQEELQGA
jgi:hypothetical protein